MAVSLRAFRPDYSPRRTFPLAPRGSIPITMALSDIVATVTPVCTYRAGSLLASASGFFYYYSGSLHLVTSRAAVVDLPDELCLRLHTDPDDLTQHEELRAPLFEDGAPIWQEHPTRADEVDLVTIPLDGDEMELRYVIRAFSILDQVPRDIELPLGEDVLVVGFPQGLYDDVHNLPIVRSATIASVYPVPFQGQPLGALDVVLPATTAGAPVVTKGSPVVRTQDGQTTLVDKGENYLAGIHAARSPIRTTEGASEATLSSMYYPWVVPEIISQRA